MKVGFLGLLTLLLIALKLTGCIAWSWFWVICPLFIPLAIVAIVIGGGAALGGMAYLAAVIYEKMSAK